MSEASELVLDLLNYIEQVEKLKHKPAFTVPTDYFIAHQHELRGLPELQFNLQVDNDDVWLRLPRLQEIAPPEPAEELKPWVGVSKSPDKKPELKNELVVIENKQEVSRELLKNRSDVQVLFHAYLSEAWTPWSTAEAPRRKTIAYYNKLFALQQAISTDGAETPLELVWGVGYAAWKHEASAMPLRHPLIIQSCEVTLNEKTFDLEVRPRDVEARLEADCFSEMELPGVKQLEAFWKSFLGNSDNRPNPFEASTFDGVLKAAVGHLDPTGAYEVRIDDVAPPVPGEKLKVTNTWVLFGRKRSGDIFLEDVRRLKKNIEEADELPSVIRGFVEQGDSTVRLRAERAFRGLSSSESAQGALELYFPMPYNDEQVSIVQKLEDNDGVVVQGPPGTGKTHTIANVVCHYLAQGKRVLVTAKSETALSVLQEKLPEAIRPLSVSLLSDEHDGMKQFEHSVQTIASSVNSFNPSRSQAVIEAAQGKLDQLHAKIAHVDRKVAEHAGKHMRTYSFQGKDVTPEEMAKLVLSQADDHQWLDDRLPIDEGEALPFADGDVASLRRARLAVGDALAYLGHQLPTSDEFLSWSDLLALHQDLVKARSIDASVTDGQLLALADSRLETFEKAQALGTFLDERSVINERLEIARQGWLNALEARMRDLQSDDPLVLALHQTCAVVKELETTRRELLTQAIELPRDAEMNEDYCDAVARQCQGKSAFALPFGKSDARKLVAATTVLGSPVTGKDSWKLAQATVEWRRKVRQAIARWNSLSQEFSYDAVSGSPEEAFKAAQQQVALIEGMRRLTFEFDAHLPARIAEVFGAPVADRIHDDGEPFLETVKTSIQAQVDKGRLAYAMRRIQEQVRKLDGKSGFIVEEISSFLTASIGRASADEAVLHTTWNALQAELTRVTALQPALREIVRVADLIEAAGAPKWAHRVRTEAAAADIDVITPSRWLEAWHWRCAVQFLDQIDGHAGTRELFEERRTLTNALARTYQELVAEKTWLGVYQNSPDNVRQALQRYLNAVQSMGVGTGIRAIRHRKTARDAMTQAYQAVPCWVLPQWRVSETLPAEVGLFDLVIIDEASQSDIWALPALLRGKKLLVVGDHKQVSPSAVGTAEEKIKELVSRFLQNQPHGSEMTPDKSIYDLARVVFAGNSVMLKEHFRCVPAIIEFSNREFYQGEIKPLRLPKAHERLDPPLVDVYVKGGTRKGDVNPAEAQAIVDEIKAILTDDGFAGRTIGVVTLLGTKQAALITKLVSQQISQHDIVGRKIAVGAPPVFQGRERDIMMVSMVVAPGGHAAQTKADIMQRFNVALSRARDRMYLFRSIDENTFREDSLNSRLVRHFRQPFNQDARKVSALRDKCESGFETEVFDELVKRGYRVQPQVPCGGYRIDFVVEGNEGRRLAVECDGDRFHGPGQWQDDMARQRVLERAGWTFWRCFASSFVRRRAEVLNDLVATLERLGIEPLGSESVDNTLWVHSKEVDPLGVEEEAELT